MDVLGPLTERVKQGISLEASAAATAARTLADPEVSFEAKKTFLEALHAKGETVEEVTAFAQVFRGLARDPGLSDVAGRAIDIVGTGGSGSGGYNVSSAAAVTVAACGVPVLKHGNRAVTSQSGSADFLGVLGLPIQDDPAVLRRSVEALDFCFFFAPAFHPAFKDIVPVRKALAEEGKRTIFNILGPLINPAQPAFQLLGVFHEDWVRPLAEVLTGLGLRRGLAAMSRLSDGRRMDELTTAGVNRVTGVGELRDLAEEWRAADFGLSGCDPVEVTGGNPGDNVVTFEAIINGSGPAGLTDTIAFNAGTALYLTGAVPDVRGGVGRAREALGDGTVREWLERARSFYRELSA